MTEEHGVVVQCKGGLAVIRAKRTIACDGCASKDACIHGKGSDMLIEALNDAGAKPGERVAFIAGSAPVLKAGLLLYLVPALCFMSGAVLGRIAAKKIFPGQNPDLVSGLLGAAFLVCAFLGIRLYGKFAQDDNSRKPHILRVE